MAYHVGRLEEAKSLMLRSIEKDPLNSDGYIGVGSLYRSMSRPADAERALRRAIEINPQGVRTRHLLAFVLADQGKDDGALATATEEPAEWARLTALAYVHYKAGRRAESDIALQQLEATHAIDAAVQIAGIHGARGEIDAAFEWLDRAIAERDAGVSLVKCEQFFENLHGDPRWGELLSRLGLADRAP
jgi:serine/threonine-protein kinase